MNLIVTRFVWKEQKCRKLKQALLRNLRHTDLQMLDYFKWLLTILARSNIEICVLPPNRRFQLIVCVDHSSICAILQFVFADILPYFFDHLCSWQRLASDYVT